MLSRLRIYLMNYMNPPVVKIGSIDKQYTRDRQRGPDYLYNEFLKGYCYLT